MALEAAVVRVGVALVMENASLQVVLQVANVKHGTVRARVNSTQ